MNAKKAYQKQNIFRVLKILSYLAGYPLCMVLLLQAAYASGFGTKGYAVEILLGAWVLVTVVQIVMTLITKSFSARAVSVSLVSIVLLLGFSVYFDVTGPKQLQSIAESYVRDYKQLGEGDTVTLQEEDGYYVAEVLLEGEEETFTVKTDIYTYDKCLAEIKPWSGGGSIAGSIGSLEGRFCSVYNIGGSSRGSDNTDGSEVGPAREKRDGSGELEYWFGETGDVYSENGLYNDAYIPGTNQAIEILLTIYHTQAQYKEMGKDADEELEKALLEVESSREWLDYVASEEYQSVYGEGGTAYKYMLTEERMDDLLAALIPGIFEAESISDLLGIATTFSGSIQTYVDAFKQVKSVDDAIAALGTLGLSVDKQQIMDLVNSLAWYQMPSVLPKMYFIEDDDLRTYAYAKYYAEDHGATVGSVLYAEDQENGKIGKITMSDSGVSIKDNAFSEEDMYKIRANRLYGNFFQKMLARRYAYYFAAFTALAFLFAYFFGYKQWMNAVIVKKAAGIPVKR